MFQYKNLYFRLLSPNGTSEIGVKFELSSADVASEQPFLTLPQTDSSSKAMPDCDGFCVMDGEARSINDLGSQADVVNMNIDFAWT